MKLFIITGASSGLGLALAEIALSQGDLVIGISRGPGPKHENFHTIKHDLGSFVGLDKKIDRVLKKINQRSLKTVHLINNAAAINPIGLVGKLPDKGIEGQLSLNLTTPLQLTNFVIKTFKKKAIITNIISGAAEKAISGWSLYCSTKSGLKMFTECLAAEGVKTLSFSPGVMDTSMQATIRKQKTKDFSRVNEFKEYKDKKMLLPADKVGMLLMNLLNAPSFKKTHYSVKDL